MGIIQMRARATSAVVLAVIVLGWSMRLDAHDVPADTVVNAFAKVDGNTVDVLIRVPLDLLEPARFPIDRNVLDLSRADAAVARALRGIGDTITFWENGERLLPTRARGRLSLPSDRAFGDFDNAAAHIEEPLASDTEIYRDQGFLDTRFVYRLTDAASVLAIQTTMSVALGPAITLSLRYLPATGAARAFIITSPSAPISLNPAWYAAASGFVLLGVDHILSGADHLLFLLCLILPFRRIRALLGIVTAFTLGHSVTLIGSAYGLAPAGGWFQPFVETAIAASIVFMAIENILGANLRRRWVLTGVFGLVHGFGFSYALQQDLQFAGSHLLLSLFSFNVGIEIGQFAVLSLMVAGTFVVFRGAMAGRMGVTVVSALVVNTAWDWMLARANELWQTEWPRVDMPTVAALLLWTGIAVVGMGASAAVIRWIRSRRPELMQVPSRSHS